MGRREPAEERTVSDYTHASETVAFELDLVVRLEPRELNCMVAFRGEGRSLAQGSKVGKHFLFLLGRQKREWFILATVEFTVEWLDCGRVTDEGEGVGLFPGSDKEL